MMYRARALIIAVAAAAVGGLATILVAGADSAVGEPSAIAPSRGFIPRASLSPDNWFTLAVPSGTVAPPLPVGGPATTPEPIFGPTSGTLIGERAALDKAATLAVGPIARQEVRLLAYREVSAFAGNVITTIHPDRLFYIVVTSAVWQPTLGAASSGTCLSYIAVIDAENGHTRGVLCGGDAAWPTRLPAVFGP